MTTIPNFASFRCNSSLDLETLQILDRSSDALLHTLRLRSLTQTRSALPTSLTTNYPRNLTRPLDSIDAFSSRLLGDIAAVHDFTVAGGVGREQVDGLVLVGALLGVRDCLDRFGNGFAVGGHVFDVDDGGAGVRVRGEVGRDGVENFFVLGFEERFLVIEIVLFCVSVVTIENRR